MENKIYPNAGHRARLRARFLQSGFDGFLDYEVLELILTLGTPRKDCKQQAKQVLQHFKTLPAALTATLDELQQVKGVGPANAIGIKIFQELNTRFAKREIEIKNILDTPQKIAEYVMQKIGNEQKEHFMLLCFDTRNKLIDEEIVSVGTLNASLVHPREVFKKAILCSASHVVVAHNHPSGDPTPSADDIATTQRLVEAGKLLGITVVDHVVVSNNSWNALI